MKQVVQHLKSGAVRVEDVPPPALRVPGALVATTFSLISPGTERAAVELGRSSLLGKALRRPDQVRKVLDSLRREGLAQTVEKVRQRLDVTRAMGYSCAGVVLESRDCEILPGMRVACAGTDAATHAEINFVPRNLCAAIPEGVSSEEAAFVALGGIALHALHLAAPQLGEEVAVLGLGPVGLLLAQALRAAGCRVAGFDLRPERLAIAARLGIEHTAFSDRRALQETLRGWNIYSGFDHVFIAAASQSNEPVEWAVEAAADRGTLVVVGDVRTDLPRNACYAKELRVMYARSYGPGRYDPAYEERGIDYPQAQVRWTLQRNLAAFLDLVARKQIQVAPLITHRFPIEQAARAYEVVGGAEPSLGVLLEYPLAERKPASTLQLKPLPARASGAFGVGFIGAGAYASSYLLPALKKESRVRLVNVATSRGVTAKKVAEQFGFARCTTDTVEILREAEVDVVFIATRHDTHAALATAAIEAGKSVFVEKPLALSEEELERIVAAQRANPVALMVGHNRRFAPATLALQKFLERSNPEGELLPGAAPVDIRYTVHAGALPEGHWLRDPAQGGRIVGEACHFVDWCMWVAGAPLEKLFAVTQGSGADQSLNAVLHFAGGSTATLAYDTQAHRSLPKEFIEVSCAGRSAMIEDFARGSFFSAARRTTATFRGKGQAEMMAVWLRSFASEKMLTAFPTWVASARATLKLLESASTGLPVWFEASR